MLQIVQKCVVMKQRNRFSFATCRFVDLFFPTLLLFYLHSCLVLYGQSLLKTSPTETKLVCLTGQQIVFPVVTLGSLNANKSLGHRFSPNVWCGTVFASVLCIVSSLLDNLASERGKKWATSMSDKIICVLLRSCWSCLRLLWGDGGHLGFCFCSYNNWPAGGGVREWHKHRVDWIQVWQQNYVM